MATFAEPHTPQPEPPLAALQEAARTCSKTPSRALLDRARAGRYAVVHGHADPELTLALVVWPSETVLDSEAAVASAANL